MINYLRKNKLLLFIYGIFSLVTYAFLTLIFTSYSWITDIALNNDLAQGKVVTIQVMLMLLGMLIFVIIMFFIERYILYRVSKSLRGDMVNKLLDLNYNSFYEKDNVYYSSMIVNDVDILENEYYMSLVDIIGEVIQILVMIFFIAKIDLKYVFIILLLTIPSLIQPSLLKKKIGIAGLNSSKAMTRYNDKTNEYIYGMEEITTSNKHTIFQEKFKDDVFKLEDTRYNEKFLGAINFVLAAVVIYFLKVGALIVFVNDVVAKLIEVSAATALFGYANNIGNPVSSILDYYEKINASKNVKEKVDTFLNEGNDFEDSLDDIDDIERIDVKNLSFSYNDTQVLKNINFTFNKGYKYAIFGGSGSGKSTLIKLIMGFYKTYDGQIFFNDMELKTIKNSSLWKQMAYIQQKVFIMSGTLKDNITLFSNKYTDDEINKAVKFSGLDGLIKSLPNGIDTYIEEGGKNFSGGEKQRISLARALLSDKSIFLLDESFSALDNKNSMEIEKNILDIDKTIIMISHRPNDNLYKYDDIIVFKDGEIAEHGLYDELLKKDTYFYNLIQDSKGGENDEEKKQCSSESTFS
ncbi:ABC transporter ATP-binding protein [Acidilutibacter cellobiosedens]|jgi:ATP-binding cassette subfamily C protein|uniref:ABC transporter ATP-binding protein n=1 Tax=Acidilutibacter cellobiosedens TaxID=2507161 RepID=A0A410QEH4_9FIRM|nr:ABC transporter ATP-binding protein [Acidilutibacter cellobiosedens]QAT62387.1 ABC transporter ATP-binding protein [Acidilutibacter cellobiosedens]